MKTFVAILVLVALFGKNANGMTTSCPVFEPSDFCSQEIQPYHCANTAELACSANSNCCKDGCGKFRCLPKASKTSLHPDTFLPRNPIGCPAFDMREMCTFEIQVDHCANSAEHACPSGSVCCRDYCRKHRCFVSNAPRLDDSVLVKSTLNPAGCPKVPVVYEPFCTLEIQEKHCANSWFHACPLNENCCANICGKYHCLPKVEA